MTKRELIADTLVFLGGAAVVWGVWLVHHPTAIALSGAGMIAAARLIMLSDKPA